MTGAERFLALILEGDRRGAERHARRILERHGVPFLYEEVVQPALQEIGQLWSANQINVADEHLASATAEAAIAALYPRFPWPEVGPRAVIACPEGERHVLGARMVADLLALDGWDERFVGADVPVEDLVRKVKVLAPVMVGISVTIPAHLPVARSAIERMRAVSPNVKILAGGRVVADQDAAASLRADAIAYRASEAVEVCRGWK